MHVYFLIFASILSYLIFKFDLNQTSKFYLVPIILFIFIILYFSSNIYYWSEVDDLIFKKISPSSEYYYLSQYIKILVPIIYFISSLIFIFFLNLTNNVKDLNSKKIFMYLLFILFIFLFFLESFSTFNFFSSKNGGPLYHWQAIIGPNELIDQGGYLLWDAPSNYGYFNHILIYLFPLDNNFHSLFFINGFLVFLTSIIFLFTLWYSKNISTLIISFALTYILLFILPTGQSFENVSGTPAAGPFRFFWVILLLFILVNFRKLSIFKQFIFIYPIFIIGFFWSFESAFFVSSVMLPIFFHYILYKKNTLINLLLFLSIPITIIIILLLISFFYKYNLNHLPDYYMFIEAAVSNTRGYFNNIIVSYNELFICFILLFSIIYFSKDNEYYFLFYSVLMCLWSVSIYFVGQSEPIIILKIFMIYIFGYLLLFKLLQNYHIKKFQVIIFSIFFIIFTFSISNPRILLHIYGTFYNQDLKFSNIKYDFDSDYSKLLNNINLNENIPILFIEKSRYLNVLEEKSYYNVHLKKNINISDEIFFPIYPPSSIVGYSEKRINIFLERWIKKNDFHEFDYVYLILPNLQYFWSRKFHSIINNKNNNLYKVLSSKYFDDYKIYKLKINEIKL